MINDILQGLIKFIISLVSIFLTPINLLVSQYMPSLDNAFNSIASFLGMCTNSIGWVISALGIPSIVIQLIVSYYTFKLTVPLLVSAIKIAIKWYHALMP